ncbi:MAG: hypothetical protein SGI99_05550 [Pseudomonadota bacterium]|nr:hypothetical protein [Pseudomonadota bacterium]
MSLIRTVSGLLLLSAALAGCSKSSSDRADTAAATITGIADCDNFLNAYEQCLADKVPAAASAQMKLGIDQWKNAWKSMAENSATRDSLPQICAQTRAASAPALQAYGCTL